MPSIQKRLSPDGTVRYRAVVRLKDHRPDTATFQKKADAVAWAQATESRIRQSKYFPDKSTESEKHTLGDLLDRYRLEILPGKKAKGQSGQLKWWQVQLGERKLKSLSPALISSCKEKLVTQPSERTGRKRTPATVNRYLALLGHVFTVAVREWEWMAVNPVAKISKLKEPGGRTRFLSDEERERLLTTCRSSESIHLFIIVTLALSTGMRRGEILGMKWENIDLKKKRITLVETKNGETRVVPLVGKAYELMKNLYLKVQPVTHGLVFSSAKNLAEPGSIRTAWETALKRAKMENFRFHDLRHSTASYLAMNGATLLEIAGILGHKTLQMVKRYSHLSEDHKAEVLEKMNRKVFGAGAK
ncbi:MAG: site-specific integrase [Nitrospina sp.]|nr:site-specific integrase [Nitrospina sp.]